jgi:4'-phosphopantetheinyl transferase
MSYWMAHDAITFLVDLGGYRPALNVFLTNAEKEQVLRYKPVIARRRFVMSRTILKHILSEILQEEDVTDIILTRNADGRILVKDEPHVFICLSYYGTSIAITVGKRKIGSDIEGVRPARSNKITASPFFHTYPCAQGKEQMQQVIHVWTLVESYAKLYDRNPYPLLNRCSPFMDADFVSYIIDQQMIFSLASAQGHFTEVLVWLDI